MSIMVSAGGVNGTNNLKKTKGRVSELDRSDDEW